MIRYAQCWEDADVLLEGLDPQPGDTCVSIASAGDNTLALLTRNPGRVIALDRNPAQLACLELRVAAYRVLSHDELLELIGSRPCDERAALYARCRALLSDEAQIFWDERPDAIEAGIGSVGKFEAYFQLFRRYVLPPAHNRRRVQALLMPRTRAKREVFYDEVWDNRRWRLLFQAFFSRFVMGRLGRDPSFFRYVEGRVADRICERVHHAVTVLDPSDNPYLHWILTGRHGDALPLALRPAYFDMIRANLDRLEWRCQSVEAFLNDQPLNTIDRFNLSDIFEYMSEPDYHHLLTQLADTARPGARLAYWNMLAPRRRPEHLAHRLRPLEDLSRRLHTADKAFFYSAFIIEEVIT